MIPQIFLDQLPGYFRWRDRMLAKLISEEEQENVQNSSKPEKTGVVSMPTMRKQAASVSEENETVLVPNVWSDSESTLGIQASKGGRPERNKMNTPAQGTLVVKLVRLESSFKDLLFVAQRNCKENGDNIVGHIAAGEAIAYDRIVRRLDQLIASESGTKPKGR